MKEMAVRPGDFIARACERLAEAAPAFMVFNDTRVEARPGETADQLYAKWTTERERRQRERMGSMKFTPNDRISELEGLVDELTVSRDSYQKAYNEAGERVRELEAFIRTVKCYRCGAIKGTHGSPCIDLPNHDDRWARHVHVIAKIPYALDSGCTATEEK